MSAAFAPAGLSATAFAAPRTLAEACTLLARARSDGKRAVVLAGGTDWIVDRHLMPPEKAAPVDQVVDVTRIDPLSTIAFKKVDGEQWLTCVECSALTEPAKNAILAKRPE